MNRWMEKQEEDEDDGAGEHEHEEGGVDSVRMYVLGTKAYGIHQLGSRRHTTSGKQQVRRRHFRKVPTNTTASLESTRPEWNGRMTPSMD